MNKEGLELFQKARNILLKSNKEMNKNEIIVMSEDSIMAGETC